jgi:hypothetical protein
MGVRLLGDSSLIRARFRIKPVVMQRADLRVRLFRPFRRDSISIARRIVNGWSAVRSRSPAPRSEGVKPSVWLGSWNERHRLVCLTALRRLSRTVAAIR